MSTDRELLELAAKALGIEVWTDIDGNYYTGVIERHWNPLTDDGDALRLAVKLKIDIHHGEQWAEAIYGRTLASICTLAEYFRTEDERQAATRRCVVRAAAEIGRLQ